MQDFIEKVEGNKININLDRTFNLEQVSEGHQYMEKTRLKVKLW